MKGVVFLGDRKLELREFPDPTPVRSWGTARFIGERGQVTLDVNPDLLRRQVTLVGSWTFSKQGQAQCAEFVADRHVDVEKLFTHRWKPEQAEEAY